MAEDWRRAFEKELEAPYFLEIKRFLEKDGVKSVIYPAPNEIYSFTKLPLDSIKVVILGQDPYHGPDQAHGLSFSVKKGVRIPPSLFNIYKELENDLGSAFSRPNHGFLDGWASEGVLLLNAALTVRKGDAASHRSIGWARFTDAIVSHINKNREHVVFLLWGADAQRKGAGINKNKHLVLTSVHPSPLSANRGGWFGNHHFSKANAYLDEHGIVPVNWNHLP
ncbi:uracil-DNA glycosylase [Blyttiomyces helicus]|uniref:Uracil-DNA glycosylase n=1 Tax=Blyttiomyces helicus TaxID=388810 RepID=A0A4P9WBS0_9FUNG|nr:uracil-DNA glycosylase [Blyttiomyces helicus]|eukprot:RKO88360.1 uracil-DNA glycosylase [Blyttiomyces helicus]